jgi:hypothetical protein
MSEDVIEVMLGTSMTEDSLQMRPLGTPLGRRGNGLHVEAANAGSVNIDLTIEHGKFQRRYWRRSSMRNVWRYVFIHWLTAYIQAPHHLQDSNATSL